MKLLITGSAAADKSRTDNRLSPDYRRYSSALLDRELLIDAGPHLYGFAEDFGYGEGLYSGVVYVLQTHSHADHFSPTTLKRLLSANKKLVFIGDPSYTDSLPEGIGFLPAKPYERISLGDYAVTPLPANHATELPEEQPLHYIIEKAGKTLYYGTDGAWLLRGAREELGKHRFDLMIFDCTVGDNPTDWRLFEHNCIPSVRLMLASLRAAGIFKETGIAAVTHLAPTLHASHADTVKMLAADGIEVCFDNREFVI